MRGLKLCKSFGVEQHQGYAQKVAGQQNMPMSFVNAEIKRIGQWIFLRIDPARRDRLGQVAHVDRVRIKPECAEHTLMIFIGQRAQF